MNDLIWKYATTHRNLMRRIQTKAKSVVNNEATGNESRMCLVHLLRVEKIKIGSELEKVVIDVWRNTAKNAS